jgi:hypothetical protein
MLCNCNGKHNVCYSRLSKAGDLMFPYWFSTSTISIESP